MRLVWGTLQMCLPLEVTPLPRPCDSSLSAPICGSLARPAPPSQGGFCHHTLHPAPRPLPSGQLPVKTLLAHWALTRPGDPQGWHSCQQPHPAAPNLSPQDVNIEDLYKGGEQATRFTFFQRSVGPAFRLEAAAWPGWFLCGPDEPQQPVRLAREPELSARTTFYFEQSW